MALSAFDKYLHFWFLLKIVVQNFEFSKTLSSKKMTFCKVDAICGSNFVQCFYNVYRILLQNFFKENSSFARN